jgi:6-phosphogluconolactonase
MKTQVTYKVFDSPGALSSAAAEHFASQAEAAAASRGIARIAISGGHTPKEAFELLANPAQPFYARMPWERLQIYWVDERCVPPDHADSNYRMTREALLSKVPLTESQIFRMQGELDPEEAASRYESLIRSQFRLEGSEIPSFDVVALGMGDDGHTASLFPHTGAIHETSRIVVANRVPQKDTWRITLTWPVINQARDVFFLIAGSDKAAVLKKVLTGPRDVETFPSQLIRPASGRLSMLLDTAAAAELPAAGGGSIEVSD